MVQNNYIVPQIVFQMHGKDYQKHYQKTFIM